MAYGNAAYAESSLKSALRIAAAGLGSVPRGANFGTAFAAAAGGASRAYGAAEQAAQEYALKQQQQQEEQDFRQYQIKNMDSEMRAREKAKEPEWWQLPPDQQQGYIASQAALAKATADAKGTTKAPDFGNPP